MLQQQDGAGGHLPPAEVPGPGSVQEVRVHRRGRDPVAREQLTQIVVAGVGKVVHPMVAVDDEGHRTPVARFGVGQVEPSVPGSVRQAETPPPLPVGRAEPAPLREQQAQIHRRRPDGDLFPVFGPVLVPSAAVGQEANPVGAALGRIFREHRRRPRLRLRAPDVGVLAGCEEPRSPGDDDRGAHEGEQRAGPAVRRPVRAKQHGEAGADEERSGEDDHHESGEERVRPAEDGAPQQPQARPGRRQQQEGVRGKPPDEALGDPAQPDEDDQRNPARHESRERRQRPARNRPEGDRRQGVQDHHAEGARGRAGHEVAPDDRCVVRASHSPGPPPPQARRVSPLRPGGSRRFRPASPASAG